MDTILCKLWPDTILSPSCKHMGDQYKVRFLELRLQMKEHPVWKQEYLTSYLGRNQQLLDLSRFIIVLGRSGWSGLISGLGKFFKWFAEHQFWKIFIALLSPPLSLKTIYSEAGHCTLRIISSLFQALHCSEPLRDKSLEFVRSSYGDYTSVSAF